MFLFIFVSNLNTLYFLNCGSKKEFINILYGSKSLVRNQTHTEKDKL